MQECDDVRSAPRGYSRRLRNADARARSAVRDGCTDDRRNHDDEGPPVLPLRVSRCGATIADGELVAFGPDPRHPTGHALGAAPSSVRLAGWGGRAAVAARVSVSRPDGCELALPTPPPGITCCE